MNRDHIFPLMMRTSALDFSLNNFMIRCCWHIIVWFWIKAPVPNKVVGELSISIRPPKKTKTEILECVFSKVYHRDTGSLWKPRDLFNLTYLSHYSNKCHCLLETNSWPCLLSVWLFHVQGFGRETLWGAVGWSLALRDLVRRDKPDFLGAAG